MHIVPDAIPGWLTPTSCRGSFFIAMSDVSGSWGSAAVLHSRRAGWWLAYLMGCGPGVREPVAAAGGVLS